MSQQVSIDELVNRTSTILHEGGLSESDADIIVQHLLDAELAGKSSHGFYRFAKIAEMVLEIDLANSMVKEIDTIGSAIINGGGTIGILAATEATQVAIEKAKSTGFSIVGANNYVGTTGTMGYYVRRAAEEDLIGIVFCNSEYAVAPWGSKDAILGTNPIAVGIPNNLEPIVVDLATSAWSYGSLALAMRNNQQIPEGIVLDSEGNASTNPNDADNGAMLPMAGHKGYALGMIVELLAGPLIKAKAGRFAVPGSDGFLIMIISPTLFGSIEIFKASVDALIKEIKESATAPHMDNILIPGEKSARLRELNKASGYLYISDSVLQDIERLNVTSNRNK